jgi:hypothetical protein
MNNMDLPPILPNQGELKPLTPPEEVGDREPNKEEEKKKKLEKKPDEKKTPNPPGIGEGIDIKI